METGSNNTWMTFLKKVVAKLNELYKFSRQPELNNPSLIVGWTTDAGKMGAKVVDFLIENMKGERFCEIEPVEFFPLNGIAVENDLIQVPQSQFFSCPGRDLILFKSYPPQSEWYRFLSLLLEIGQQYQVSELYVVGGMITSAPHTTPRAITGTCNSVETKTILAPYDIVAEFNYQTPSGQRPTLNSYLLWMAQRKNIPAASLWSRVPVYLVNAGDPLNQKMILDFLNRRLDLGLDLDPLTEAVKKQNVKIAEIRQKTAEIDNYINRLETNLDITEEETQKLIFEIENSLLSDG
jgi:proteasome assembly chaperone (PAC2) family protein